jgi:serine/threonine protein kinase
MKTCPKCKLTYPLDREFCFVDGMDLVNLVDPRIGTTLGGRYLLEHILGEGGMATVYAARHTLVDRTCAIKVMSPLLARDVVVRERFRREAKSAQRLSHPNVIEIYDHGETPDGTSFIVMEKLDGISLGGLISQGPIAIGRALQIMIQICRGIARAHDLDVIHRDLKPENIFITWREDRSDLVKLLDFGIARSLHDSRLTGQGELFGTPQYMAPERITNTDAGPPADLYALGIIFFEMVTGELPFQSADIASFFVKHLKDPPARARTVNPAVPEALEDLILRLLAKDPKNRPVDAHRVQADLVTLAQQLGVPIPRDPQIDPVPSARPEPSTVRAEESIRWSHRTGVFERMLTRAFAGKPPAEQTKVLEQLKSLVTKIDELRDASVAEQTKLEQIGERGREGRQRFGFAVDALGVDASRAKEEARVAAEAYKNAGAACAKAATHFLAVHKEVSRWEGRSGFREPYSDLASAYRGAADQVDVWLVAREEELRTKSAMEVAARAVSDIEFQIHELRAALVERERQIESDCDEREKTITKKTAQAGALEAELVALFKRFAEPLRTRPELGALFKELDGDAAA